MEGGSIVIISKGDMMPFRTRSYWVGRVAEYHRAAATAQSADDRTFANLMARRCQSLVLELEDREGVAGGEGPTSP